MTNGATARREGRAGEGEPVTVYQDGKAIDATVDWFYPDGGIDFTGRDGDGQPTNVGFAAYDWGQRVSR